MGLISGRKWFFLQFLTNVWLGVRPGVPSTDFHLEQLYLETRPLWGTQMQPAPGSIGPALSPFGPRPRGVAGNTS